MIAILIALGILKAIIDRVLDNGSFWSCLIAFVTVPACVAIFDARPGNAVLVWVLTYIPLLLYFVPAYALTWLAVRLALGPNASSSTYRPRDDGPK